MSSAPSTGPALRQLRWPAPPAVDLLDEFHWLVSPIRREVERAGGVSSLQLLEETRRQLLDGAGSNTVQPLLQPGEGQSSPYRQQLRRPKPPAPTPGSPAQQAAKQILQLKEELQHLKGTEWLLHDEPAIETEAVSASSRKQRYRIGSPTTRSPSKPIRVDEQSKRPRQPLSAASPSNRSPSCRGQSRKKKRLPSREERELFKQQARLAAWLQTHPDNASSSPDCHVRAGDDSNDDSTPDTVYSYEVESRIEAAMQCRAPLESGVGLWDDPVRSILAAEMTSETVFGGLVPTRGLAFQSSIPVSPPKPRVLQRAITPEPSSQSSPDKPFPTQDEVDSNLGTPAPVESVSTTQQHVLKGVNTCNADPSSAKLELSDHARQVHATARRQVADGAVLDALATLEAGIRQSLSTAQAHQDAASASNGPAFNYSGLAHTKATQLQLVYRARHRRRLERLVFLQRQWRQWFAVHSAETAVRYETKNALVIQRAYRRWHVRATRERSAARLQRCFRTFESQKHLILFRQICRLLVAQELQRRAKQARQRCLWSRVRLIGRLVLTWQARRRKIVCVQSLWRGRCARMRFKEVLAAVSDRECARRAREDAFVAARLAQARSHFRCFLSSTSRGRELVRWQMEKPWLRFRRLRRDRALWERIPLSDKVGIVARLLPGRRLRGLQRRSLCQMLIGKRTPLPALPPVVEVSTEGLQFLLTGINTVSTSGPRAPLGCCPWWGAVRRSLKRAGQQITQRVAAAWWPFVLWPKEYCLARVWPNRSRRKLRARQQLEDDCARVLTGFLRERFRQTPGEANAPPYACQWCGQPFAIASEFFAHRQCQAARSQATAEWQALELDLDFALRRRWRKRKSTPHKYQHTDIGAFQLDESIVRGLQRSRSGRRALRPLLAVVEACASDSGGQAEPIPLDLLGFLLEYVGRNDKLHPLLRSAEFQVVRGRWEATRCVSKLDLHARLRPESRWRLRWPSTRLESAASWKVAFPRWKADGLRRKPRPWAAGLRRRLRPRPPALPYRLGGSRVVVAT